MDDPLFDFACAVAIAVAVGLGMMWSGYADARYIITVGGIAVVIQLFGGFSALRRRWKN